MKEPEAFKQFDIYNRNDEDVRKEITTEIASDIKELYFGEDISDETQVDR